MNYVLSYIGRVDVRSSETSFPFHRNGGNAVAREDPRTVRHVNHRVVEKHVSNPRITISKPLNRSPRRRSLFHRDFIVFPFLAARFIDVDTGDWSHSSRCNGFKRSLQENWRVPFLLEEGGRGGGGEEEGGRGGCNVENVMAVYGVRYNVYIYIYTSMHREAL